MDFEARLRLDQLDKDLQALHNSFRESAEKAKAEHDKLNEAIRRTRQTHTETSRSISKESNAVLDEINKLKAGMVAYLSLAGAKALATEIFNVRTQFQQLEISFTTMLQSKAKADQLMGEMVELAAKTPFGLQEVSEGAKRLLAFQIPAEQVTDTLRRMGDVASGLGVPMGQLIHVYGQVKAQGKLMTNDLYQFME